MSHIARSAGFFDLHDYRWQLLSPTGTLLASDGNEPISEGLEVPFATPVGDWTLRIAPRDGWGTSASLPVEIGLVVAVGLLIGLGTYFGLSSRRRLEKQVAKRTEELADTAARLSDEVDRREQTVRDLKITSEMAEKASRAKTEFLSRMSHELRTPLNAVLGFAQLLEMEQLGEADTESVSEILGAGRHLLNLINEVLDLASIEEGRLAVEHQLVDLREVATKAQRMLEPDACRSDVEILVEGDGDDLFADADTQRVHQIIINLLANAVKYGASGGEIAITLERSHDHCRVVVTDHGPGIDPTRAHLLFQPFERLGARDGPQPGTGIGLALSRRLAEVMDGSIDYEPTPGGGAQFALTLPASSVPAPVPESQVRA